MGLVNILFNIVSWLLTPINFIFLSFDGIVYSLVAYSYKLFELMVQLNFNTLYYWFYPIISRITALITVLIIFVIGYNLVLYLINPEKAADKTTGGVAMIKNIAIAAVLLISYNFIFSVINETTYLLVGAPEGYEYSALFDTFGVENTPGDRGLITRLVFGGDGDENVDFGKELAINTLGIFLHGNSEYYNMDDPRAYDDSEIGKVYKEISEGSSSFDMMAIVGVADRIWDDVDYKFPLLSTAVGAYLIWTICSISIAVGIRALKMVFLQILAPVAIVTIMKDGATKSNKVWGKYLEVLGKTFIDVFIRVAAMYFTVGFVSQAWSKIGELFSNAPDTDGVTKFFLLILIVIAGFKFAKELPKLIDDLLGSHLADNNKNGLGQFLGAAGGAIVGAAGGLVAGGFSGAKNAGKGFGNRVRGALGGMGAGLGTGFGKGMLAGWKTKGDSISEVFKAGKGVADASAGAGAVGLGGYIAGSMDAREEKRSSRELEDLKKMEDMKGAALARKGKVNTKYMNDKGETIKMDLTKDMSSARQETLSKSKDYLELQRRLKNADENGGYERIEGGSAGESSADIRAQILDMEKEFDTAYKTEVAQTLKDDVHYSKMADNYSKQYSSEYNKSLPEEKRKTAEQIKDEFINNSSTAFKERKAEIKYGSTQRTIRQRQGKDNKGGSK